jgi:hypothetical protein
MTLSRRVWIAWSGVTAALALTVGMVDDDLLLARIGGVCAVICLNWWSRN